MTTTQNAANAAEELVFTRPASLADRATHYCPGCHHGIAHRLVAELLDEMDLAGRTVAASSIGCSVFLYNYIKVDTVESPHGRAPAVATGIKRARPECFCFTYQGDGDLASIGIAEIIHAAARSENITVIFINNAIYGMTGGQMAPTTLLEQQTTTSPLGRDAKLAGYPIKVSEMLATLEGATYITRQTVNSPKSVNATKRAMKKAFQNQLDGKGFSLVEVLSTCPTYWGKTPKESMQWIDDAMCKQYPLGDVVDRS